MLTDEKEKGSHSPFPSKELPGGLRAICVAEYRAVVASSDHHPNYVQVGKKER